MNKVKSQGDRRESEMYGNVMRTPDGTILYSAHRHDYSECRDTNGKVYMLDGGSDYMRCSANGDEEFLSVMSSADHVSIRHAVTWSSLGKGGKLPYRRITIAGMDTDHLQACMRTQGSTMSQLHYKVMQNELEYRDEN